MTGKKHISAPAVLVSLALIILLAAGCSKKRDVLVIGIDSAFPPFTYVDGDDFTGFDVELARALCGLEGWRAEFVSISWDEKENLLNDGEIDCIWCGFTINGREEDYTTTVPYCNNCYVVAVRDDSDIREFSDLAKRVVAVQAATTESAYLTETEEGKALTRTFGLLSQFSDYGHIFDNLRDGLVDAVVADVGVARHFAAENGNIRILEKTLLEDQYGVAMRKGEFELCERLNDDLLKLAADGTIRKLAQKYGIEESICIGD